MKKILVDLVIGSLILFPTVLKAQWVQTSGPGGGCINAIAVSSNKVFAGTHGKGVFFSTNNGTSWNAINSGFPSNAFYVYDLMVIGTNIFAGSSVSFLLI